MIHRRNRYRPNFYNGASWKRRRVEPAAMELAGRRTRVLDRAGKHIGKM